MTGWNAGSQRERTIGHIRMFVALLGGVLYAGMANEYPFGDAVAPLTWSLASAAVVIGLLVARGALRVWWPAVLLVAALMVPSFWSYAPGSSYAALTWTPIMLGAILLSALSPVFLLTVTAVLGFQSAGAMVILKNELTGSQVSGSVPYFLGFVGVVGAPLWLASAVAIKTRQLWSRLLLVLSVLLAALSAWLALVSGARAAVLGLAVAIAIYMVAEVIRQRRNRAVLVRLAAVICAIAVLVPLLDTGLTRFYSPTNTTTMWSVLSKRSEATQKELEADRAGGSFRTRLQFWRQAGLATLAKPLGHGPASYGHVIHTYQDRPMVWSGSPHNFLALTGVEAGVPGVLVTLGVLLLAAIRSARSSPARLAVLIGAAAVMALDIFSSQPAQNLLWLAVVGLALRSEPGMTPSPTRSFTAVRWLPAAFVVLLLSASVWKAALFASPCGTDCDLILKYSGHPNYVSPIYPELEADLNDSRWRSLTDLYPLSFSYVRLRADALWNAGNPEGHLELLRRFPNQSIENYVRFLEDDVDPKIAGDAAACGLEKFFDDGAYIWRDHRSSAAALREAENRLRAYDARSKTEAIGCAALGIE